MSPGVVDRTLSGYTVSWDEDHLTCEATGVRSHKDERLTAWLTFTTDTPGYSPVLHEAQYNLGSARTMQGLATYMQSVYDVGDWATRIQELSYLVRKATRSGEKAESLDPDSDVPPLEWILYPLIVKGYPNIIFGEGGLGKSLIAMVANACVTIPWKYNGLQLTVPDTINSFTLDWESDGVTTLRRWQQLKYGMGLDSKPMNYLHCSMPFADDIDRIVREITPVDPELLIMDSLAMACGRRDLNDPQTATEFYTIARQIDKTMLIIAHTSKEQGNRKTVFGSAFFNYYARNVWEVRAGQRESRNVITFGLFHVKDNYTGRFPPMGFKIIFGENGIKVGRIDLKKDAVLSEEQPLYRRAQQILTSQGHKGTLELADLLGTQAKKLKGLLNKYKDIFQHYEDGWGILAESEGPPQSTLPEQFDEIEGEGEEVEFGDD